tara:strand:+ start:4865 stop:5302 length:438 start_codon:yes stop_codon:yes gene_type:complete
MAYVIDDNLYNPDDYDVQWIGFRIPFSFGEPGDTMNDDTMDNIEDNLENLFNTEPGDRLFHPKLGVSFRKHLFEQMDRDLDEWQAVVKEDIETQVKRWMPFLSVDRVKVSESPDRNQYRIAVDFHITRNPKMFSSVEITTPAGAY